MTLVPIQFFGIGDIIFEQTLVAALAKGGKVLWPVLPEFVEGLNRAYPNVQFVNMQKLPLDYERQDEYEIAGMRVLPLRFADTILGVPYGDNLKSKYQLYGMDWRDWKQNAQWRRDTEKEQALLDLLHIEPGATFNLLNLNYGSGAPFQIEAPVITNDYPTVQMQLIDGFSLFDWAGVIEQAATIHTVSTSIIYLLEQLELAAPEVHLYTRKPHELDFKNVEYILQKHTYIKHL